MASRLDENLRIKFEGSMNFEFQSFINCLPDFPELLENMKKDCAKAYNRKDDVPAVIGEVSSSDYHAEGCTYFQKSNEQPRCWPEELALSIFKHHTKDAVFNPSTSGAEWWIMYVNSQDDIGFHWDRDYGFEGESGINVHPHLSTVTYFTDCGGPTVVINKNGEHYSEDDHSGTADEIIISKPKVGKHIKFDGRLLHAAPSGLIVFDPANHNVKRVTFLVNVWLNNVPLQTKKYPTKALREFTSPSLASSIILSKWKQQRAAVPEAVPPVVTTAAADDAAPVSFSLDLASVLKNKRGGVGGGAAGGGSSKQSTNGGSTGGSTKGSSSMQKKYEVPPTTSTITSTSVPSYTVSSQLLLVSSSKTKGTNKQDPPPPTLQMHSWEFVNGGDRYKIVIPLPSVDRLSKEQHAFNLTYAGSGLSITLTNLDNPPANSEEDEDEGEEDNEQHEYAFNNKKRSRGGYWKPLHKKLHL